MLSSVIPARLVFQCGHAALVSLPRIKGETSSQRGERVAREKSAAQVRACDFCGQRLEVVVQQTALVAPALKPLPKHEGVASGPNGKPIEATPPAKTTPAALHAVTPQLAPSAPPSATTPSATTPSATTPSATTPSATTPVVATSSAPAALVPGAMPIAPPMAEPLARPTPGSSARRRALAGAAIKTPALTRPVASSARRGRGRARVAGSQRFAVAFVAQAVLLATDVHDALRQAQSLGAIEVLAITQESRAVSRS